MDWFEWLAKNKEWVFSGIGVAALILIFQLPSILKRLQAAMVSRSPVATQVLAKADEPIPAPAFASPGITAVTPGDIRTAVEEAPPLQQRAVAGRYIGITIEWNTKLQYATEAGGGMVDLLLDTNSGIAVACRVKHSDYPELSILPRDTPLRAHGVIKTVSPPIVEIRDAQLIRLPQG